MCVSLSVCVTLSVFVSLSVCDALSVPKHPKGKIKFKMFIIIIFILVNFGVRRQKVIIRMKLFPGGSL